MKKTDIRNIALLAPVLYLYLNIFLWSKNVSMFSVTELICSLGAIFVLSALCYFIFYYLFSFFSATVQNVKRLKLGMGVFVGVFTGIICNFFFLRTLFYPHHHIAMYVLMVCIALIVYFNLAAYFVKFSYVLLLIASCGFVYNSYKNFSSVIEDTDKYLVEFKDKPNIYMIWLESFHGARTLKDVYDVDVSPLTKFLEENKFTVCENMYSNFSYTLATMVDLFSLGTIDPFKFYFANSDVYSQLHKIIGGGAGNNVLKVLKYNGYITNVMVGGSYYFTTKEKYLDYAPIDLYGTSVVDNFRPCFAFTKNVDQLFLKMPVFFLKGLIKQNTEQQIDKMQKIKQPYFLSIKYEGTCHPVVNNYTYKQRTEWITSGLYRQQAEKAIVEIPELIALIIKKDPNAVIVMLGDHGANTYGILANWVAGLENTDEETFFREIDNKLSNYVDDKFNVYGAIRLPAQYEKFSFENKEAYINHRNIFVHIFSLLAQDPEYLKLQEIPVSNNGKWNLVKNGVVDEDFKFK